MTSIPKQRDSNMELYRIMAMLFVMLFHAFGEIGHNIHHESFDGAQTVLYLTNMFVVSATFVCVNMFVLLSGWYGINTRIEKIKEFVFQVLFYSLILYVIFILLFNDISFSWKFLMHILLLDDYWFVPVYLMLYLFAPALNPFIKQSTHKQFLIILFSAILMQCIYGWLSQSELGFKEGCSPTSFLILYLLGTYLRRFSNKINNLSKRCLLFLYFSFIILHWVIFSISEIMKIDELNLIIWKLSSPFIIFAAACLLLLFSKINLGYNKIINWVAASSFAAFLIHCFPFFYEKIYAPIVLNIYFSLPIYASIPAIVLFVFLLYILSIFLDRIRILLYKKIF